MLSKQQIFFVGNNDNMKFQTVNCKYITDHAYKSNCSMHEMAQSDG